MEARADKGWSSTLEVSLEPAPASPFHFGLTSFVMSAPNNNSISAIGVPCTNRVRIPPPVVAHVATMAELHQDNRYGRFSNDVEGLTGIRPMSVSSCMVSSRGCHSGRSVPLVTELSRQAGPVRERETSPGCHPTLLRALCSAHGSVESSKSVPQSESLRAEIHRFPRLVKYCCVSGKDANLCVPKTLSGLVERRIG